MLNIINEIESVSGNMKLVLLGEHPELKEILEYAYNPFKRYYMTAPDVDGIEDGMPINTESKFLLNALSDRKISGNEAFEKICDHISILDTDSAELFKRILNKDLRCGISVKSINSVFPGLIPLLEGGGEKPPFMLLKNYNPKKIKYPVLVAIKKDGVRCHCAETTYSRQGKELIGHQHIVNELSTIGAFDGELCVDGKIFDEASGTIRSNEDTPESVLYIFDAPFHPGTKIERYKWICENVEQSDSVRIITHFWIQNEEQLESFFEDAISAGEEGIVIYDPESEYADKRSFDWMRLVPIHSEDLEVIGFEEGKGKFEDSLGKIIVDYKGHEVKVGTGFKEKVFKNQVLNDSERSYVSGDIPDTLPENFSTIYPNLLSIRNFIWEHRESFLGAVAEVEYKEKTKAGSLRQPRFKGWRFDK